MFLTIAYDKIYPRESGNVGGGNLGITTGDDNFCLRTGTLSPADQLAGLKIRRSCHCAGIDNVNIGGRSERHQRKASLE